MKWKIDYSRDAGRFIRQQDIHIEVKEELKKFLIKMHGGNINVDLKKLGGDWAGYYRLRGCLKSLGATTQPCIIKPCRGPKGNSLG